MYKNLGGKLTFYDIDLKCNNIYNMKNIFNRGVKYMKKFYNLIVPIIVAVIIVVNIVFYMLSEKNTIKNEKPSVEVNKEERIVAIHTGAVKFNSKEWTSDDVDGGYVFDKKHRNRGIYGEYDFVSILNGAKVQDVDYNEIPRARKMTMYLDIQPFNNDATKKLKEVDITLKITGRCDLKDFRNEVDVDFISENRGSVEDELEIIDRNESMEYRITDKKELGNYAITMFNMRDKKNNWAFDIVIDDNSIYEAK